MKILQTFTFRTRKDATDGVAFDAILKALTADKYDSANIRFCLQDSPENLGKTSAVSRVLKAFPQLKCYEGSFQPNWDKDSIRILSNEDPRSFSTIAKPLTMTVTSQAPIDSVILSEILHGVPKRFPFWEVSVLFCDIAALNVAQWAEHEFEPRRSPTHILSPGIVLSSHWGRSKRRQAITACLALPIPDGAEPESLPVDTKSLLQTLGKAIDTRIVIKPAPADLARIESLAESGRRIAAKYQENPFAAGLPTLLPRPLPLVAGSHSFGVPLIERRDAGIPSIKEVLIKEFEPLGYRYQSKMSGQGVYVLTKITPQNYEIQFSTDASPTAGQLSSALTVITPFASFHVCIQLPPHGRNYPINEHLHDVIVNTAFVVKTLEQTFLQDIENLIGPAPKWFPALKK